MSKKNECFETLRDALIVRKKVTEVLHVLALQTQKRLEVLQENFAMANTDEERDKIKNELREERFNFWLIKEECSLVATKGADLTGSLRTANTIFPTYMSEFTERRVFMDKALGACNVLQDELQYIAEGEKFLNKGVDIGNQASQNIGIVFPYRLDNYAKIVAGIHGYGRYTDDF